VTSSRLDAYCGLYCGSCVLYLATRRGELSKASVTFGVPAEGLRCDGCRTRILAVSCRDCRIRACATAKGRVSCAGCPETPCALLRELQGRLPHLGEIVDNLQRIATIGAESWCDEQAARWRCPSCRRPTEWYETTCGSCGTPVPAGYKTK